ncbi:sulfite exporter TauE/SafE family protein [Kordiimonas aestuarii]|uniref:sulfite exporter TauE/SafE family protein n=1 Tax=Kordiimonas aestuarii TaxID=1005925 RepID=UPI0021D1F92A|nr:sulfite exporter TauE/SafE family protein [Kordiimonas aestuarii]
MEYLLSHWQAALADHGGLLLTLFLGGLMGSATHCVGMCGPFVVAQATSLQQTPSLLRRVRGFALMPYHLGRMTTYVILGVVAASLSGMVFNVPLQRGIAVVLLTVAGLLFLTSAIPSLKRVVAPQFPPSSLARFGAVLGRVAKAFFTNPTAWHRYALGVTLGFLPCGLLAAALMAVAATAEPISAAFGMAAFCVGTMPALFLTGAGGRYALDRLPIRFSTLARGVMVFNSLSLFIIAGGMLLPAHH